MKHTSPARGRFHKSAFLSMTAIAMLAVTACSGKTESTANTTEPVVTEVIVTEFIAEREGVTMMGKTDYAEVIRVDLPEGESIPPHKGGDRVILSLDDYAITFEKPGEVDAKSFSAGDVHYHPAGVHEVHNIGTTPANFVIFERLSKGALPKDEPAADADDVPKTDVGATETKMFSNAGFDVYQVSVQPGGKLAPHMGFARAIYSLDNYDIMFHEGGKANMRTFKSGDVHFHNPGSHWLENKGQSAADFIIVDYKK